MTSNKIEVQKVSSSIILRECHRIRKNVFIKEMNISPEVEMGDDNDAIHFMATIDKSPAGTVRFRIIGEKAKIERLAVEKKFRRLGVGSVLINCLEKYIANNKISKVIELTASIDAVFFWEKLGWITIGNVFFQEGVEVGQILMSKYYD